MRATAERFAIEACTVYGPHSGVLFRSEELLNALQRLEWEIIRAEK